MNWSLTPPSVFGDCVKGLKYYCATRGVWELIWAVSIQSDIVRYGIIQLNLNLNWIKYTFYHNKMLMQYILIWISNPPPFQILALVEEVSRLRAALSDLQESHHAKTKQIQLLEDSLDIKRQLINRMETRLDTHADYDDTKKDSIR